MARLGVRRSVGLALVAASAGLGLFSWFGVSSGSASVSSAAGAPPADSKSPPQTTPPGSQHQTPEANLDPSSPQPRSVRPDESDRAKRLAVADQRVHAVFQGQNPQVVQVVPWFHQEHGVMLGAVVQYLLQKPVNIDPGLPQVRPPADRSRDYDSGQSDVRFEGVQSLWVFVDLRTNQVVQILPGVGARVVKGSTTQSVPDQDS